MFYSDVIGGRFAGVDFDVSAAAYQAALCLKRACKSGSGRCAGYVAASDLALGGDVGYAAALAAVDVIAAAAYDSNRVRAYAEMLEVADMLAEQDRIQDEEARAAGYSDRFDMYLDSLDKR